MNQIENQKLPPLPKPIVFFDGACPMCSREIAHYRKRRGADNIVWLDISKPGNDLDRYGISRDEAMSRFHVLDRERSWHTGAWGFVELWSQLPAYRWLAWVIKRAGLLPVLDAAYSRFARWRIRNRCTSSQACRS